MLGRALVCRSFLGALLLFAAVADAQQYRWTDRDGSVRFSSAPPPSWAKNVRKLDAPAPQSDDESLPYEVARAHKDFPVTLYTSPSCEGGCVSARAALERRGVPFKEISVTDAATIAELKSVSGAAVVPTMLVGRAVEQGFEQTLFDAALDSAGYPRAGVVPPRAPKPASAPAKPAAVAPQESRGPYDTDGIGRTGAPARPGAYGLPGGSQ